MRPTPRSYLGYQTALLIPLLSACVTPQTLTVQDHVEMRCEENIYPTEPKYVFVACTIKNDGMKEVPFAVRSAVIKNTKDEEVPQLSAQDMNTLSIRHGLEGNAASLGLMHGALIAGSESSSNPLAAVAVVAATTLAVTAGKKTSAATDATREADYLTGAGIKIPSGVSTQKFLLVKSSEAIQSMDVCLSAPQEQCDKLAIFQDPRRVRLRPSKLQ